MNLKSFLFLLSSLVLFSNETIAQNEILGNWFSEDVGNGTIEIYQDTKGVLFGKIIKSDKKGLAGKVILRNLKYQEAEKRWSGQLFNPDRGQPINVTITKTDNGKLKLIGKKYFFTKTMLWDRI